MNNELHTRTNLAVGRCRRTWRLAFLGGMLTVIASLPDASSMPEGSSASQPRSGPIDQPSQQSSPQPDPPRAVSSSPAADAPESPPNDTPPARVEVLPVLFIPQGQPAPSAEQAATVMKHVEWAQARYRELLHGDTFAIAKASPKVYLSHHPISFYHQKLLS